MANYLRMDKREFIRHLLDQGWSFRRINRETGIHRTTIRRYKNQSVPEVPADFLSEKGQNGDESLPNVPTDPFPLTQSKSVQPYLKFIQEKLELELSAQRIYQDLVEEKGYQGSYYSVKRYVSKCRKKAPGFFERLPVKPGWEAQVDFGMGPKIWDGKKNRRSWLFKMTLSYSRHSFEKLVFRQDVETFIRCHEEAFRFFGGVPQTVKLDNLKSGVLKANLYEPEFNPVYLSFSKYWDFAANPCAPNHPEQKGRVEKDVGYTKNNALKGRKFKSLTEGNLFLKHWNRRWARTRIHGTCKRQVWKMFHEEEREHLKPLREKTFAFFKIGKRKVDVYGHIEVRGSYYSVPHKLIGTRVIVHFNDNFVKVLSGEALVARHDTASYSGSVKSRVEHRPPHRPVNQEHEEMLHLQRARDIGPSCYRFIYKLFCSEDVRSINKVRGIMHLSRKHSKAMVDEACDQALARYSYSYKTVKDICEELEGGGKRENGHLLQEHELIRDLSEYQSIIN